MNIPHAANVDTFCLAGLKRRNHLTRCRGQYRRLLRLAGSIHLLLLLTPAFPAEPPLPKLAIELIPSTLDGEEQPVRSWAPASASTEPAPLLVSLHSWSGDGSQDRSEWLREAVRRNWVYIQPHFRGSNIRPEACGSPLAQQDILDAVDWAHQRFQLDTKRIYLAGVSGGGHMTMLVVAQHPERFSAASAWVGPTDLVKWYHFHTRNGRPQRYAQMVAACCGGAPGASAEVDAQYRARSPVFHLRNVGALPLDLNAGVKDGVTGSVPIHHTLRAYNSVAQSHGDPIIPEATMDELWAAGQLSQPEPTDTAEDPSYGRKILLRRTSGNTRVTIFDGTHEAIVPAACDWLSQQKRETTKSP
ncbi:MAG: alpha/beta hydrolase family protein [Planctomycetaceae bacterium]